MTRRSTKPKKIEDKLRPLWHPSLRDWVKERLTKQGYKVYEKPTDIKQVLKHLLGEQRVNSYFYKGAEKLPDLVGRKGNELCIVEAKPRFTERFVRQLRNYQTLETETVKNKTILVLPINTDNLIIWGTSELKDR